jgi:hypothetical protein
MTRLFQRKGKKKMSMTLIANNAPQKIKKQSKKKHDALGLQVSRALSRCGLFEFIFSNELAQL